MTPSASALCTTCPDAGRRARTPADFLLPNGVPERPMGAGMAQPSPVPVLAPPSRPARVAFPRGPGISASTSLVLGLAFFSFFVTCFFFLKDGALYWDNGQHFSQFRDNLHSLHAHGEIAWWFPHVQGGWPSYYYSILGFPHGASPVFA